MGFHVLITTSILLRQFLLAGSVFGTLDFSRRDLMAVNIQRGRDHGLPDYNTARKAFRLKEITKWEDINPTVCGGDINSEGCRVSISTFNMFFKGSYIIVKKLSQML